MTLHMGATAFWVTRPGDAELRPERLPDRGPDDVLVDTLFTGISRGTETLVFAGIVTNGGVASTVRDAHVRDFHAVVLADGCAAFTPEIHDTAIAALRPVAEIWSVDQATAAFEAAGS